MTHQQALPFTSPAASTVGEAPPPTLPTVPRYRLALVREAESPYSGDGAVALGHPESVARWAWETIYHDEPREAMAVIYADVRHRLLGYSVAYTGALAQTTAEPRGILAPAMLCNAAAIILLHNHPGGDPSPSSNDLAFTRRIAEAGELLGIRLLDHVIVGDDGRHVSLRRRGGW